MNAPLLGLLSWLLGLGTGVAIGHKKPKPASIDDLRRVSMAAKEMADLKEEFGDDYSAILDNMSPELRTLYDEFEQKAKQENKL